MAESNNFSDINDNFETIKTLLNSIRAQGVLNTSDVDKLLTGINSKLEKINNDEDLELVKAFLSELKKNLDERHEVLISKFGAIESLFSNLLKNSSDAVKTADMKEYFDIVATNLSVFSREVVDQKERLQDITLRLDAMRSDDSQKKDIIKSISTVRNDIEKVNNGFDSIVISLNENFKTVLKTISEVDQSEEIKGFADKLGDILDSSNTILSAIQLIDKKNNQFEDSFERLATQDDTASIQKSVVDLSAKSQELINLVETLTEKSYKIDNLAEKIDASVNIIAGLKAEIADKDDVVKTAVLEKLAELEKEVKEISSNEEFDEFKKSLQEVLGSISNGSEQLKQSLESALRNISTLNNDLKALDINSNFQNVSKAIEDVGEDVKEKFVIENEKLSKLLEVNITRTLNDISSKAEVLNTRLKESSTALSTLCEQSFWEVSESLSGLKEVVAQIDENNVSSSNAIFSNITDRLALFENSLKTSLEKQEDFVSGSSENVFEQITNVKNIIDGIEYKLDSNAIEIGNTKKEYIELTKAVNSILELDSVNVVKDVKAELYASKQDLENAVETSQNELSEGLTADLFGKYELLISKLDSVEDQIKLAQAEAMGSLDTVLKGISSSLVDILSYVSTSKEASNAEFTEKLDATTKFIQDTHLNYIDNVRGIVDLVREQIEDNLKKMSEASEVRMGKITASVSDVHQSVKHELKAAYDKLLEIQGNLHTLNDNITSNNDELSSNVVDIVATADGLKEDFDSKMNSLKQSLFDMVAEFKSDFTCENADNISELKFNSETMHTRYVQQSTDLKNELKADIAGIIESLKLNILGLTEMVSNTSLKIEGANKEVIDFVKKDFTSEVNNSVDSIKTNTADVLSEIDNKVSDVVSGFNKMEKSVNDLSKETTSSLSGTLSKILENFVSLNTNLENLDAKSAERMQENAEELRKDFEALKKKMIELDGQIDEDLAHQISIIEGSFESLNLMIVDVMNQVTDTLGERIKKELSGASSQMSLSLSEELEQYKIQISELFENLQGKNSEQAEFIKGCALELNKVLDETLDKQGKDAALQMEEIGNRMKEMIHDNIEVTAADYDDLKVKLNDFVERVERQNNVLVDTVRAQLDDVAKFVDSNLDIQAQEVNSAFEEISSEVQKVVSTVREFNNELNPKIDGVQTGLNDTNARIDAQTENINSKLQAIIDGELKPSFGMLKEKLNSFAEEKLPSFADQYMSSNARLHEELSAELTSLKNDLQTMSEHFDSAELSLMEKQLEQLTAFQTKFNDIAEGLKEASKSGYASVSDMLKVSHVESFEKLEQLSSDIKEYTKDEFTTLAHAVSANGEDVITAVNEIKNTTKTELTAISEFLKTENERSNNNIALTFEDKMSLIGEEFEKVKQNSVVCKDLINKLIQEHSDIITREIENETDIIVNDLNEQFAMLRDAHKDDMSVLTTALEDSVSGYIIDAVGDLKSYMDIKTDKSVLDGKLDSLRQEISKSFEDTAENINKLLQANVFVDALSDLRTTNEILLGTMSDKLNNQIQEFVRTNILGKMDEKIAFLDKKFVETVVDKYEEIKVLSTQQNKSFEKIADATSALVSKFTDSSDEINNNIKKLFGGISASVDELKVGFADLKAQILNKSFDEAFHESVHNQVRGIEELVREQLQYIEDINELCGVNLPEIVEMSALVKHSIAQTVNELKSKMEYQEDLISKEFNSIKDDIYEPEQRITKELNNLKTDIITQFIEIFNQVSFIAEQEEIIDFIQEKHDELITILSHIVTTSADIGEVKENITVVDNKLNELKDDIDLINEKLTSIMSSEGDIDYVYSLQDLESDIANLRIVLNEMKEDNKSKELEELIQSTNGIYEVVSTIKDELPKFEAEEFKKDFNNLAEDIVSISTRTNKLILTSDESYKTLQDNLQDFKLVINDLDERTRNFAHESGIDKLDNKLASINTMIKNGAQTNQVFNQVFEYLAEWVDRAGEQLASISDKVDTLDDIGQIRVMLEDLRAESQDSSDSEELVSALEQVFDKQSKRISSLEAKLDKIIVASNVNTKKTKSDIKPIEDALNNFLSVIEDKFVSQQDKISSLETKLEEVVSLVDNKDTAQLTKKVGGMDKQLAKLNKSIEKIASNVVEK